MALFLEETSAGMKHHPAKSTLDLLGKTLRAGKKLCCLQWQIAALRRLLQKTAATWPNNPFREQSGTSAEDPGEMCLGAKTMQSCLGKVAHLKSIDNDCPGRS